MSSTGKRATVTTRRGQPDRAGIEYAIEHYLLECFEKRAVARASEVAERLERDRAHVSRTISQVLGRSLLAALRDGQLKEAARLLVTTDLKLDEVRRRSAFGDRSTFFRLFRARYQTSPAAYRKAHAKTQQNTTLR
jgi:AraC-like DNA-binding protein